MLIWSVLDPWDIWKAVAIGLTGLFGIMGLLTSYKDKDTGRMTVWGKINLAGIVLSASMGMLSQLVEAQRKTASAQQSAREAAASASLAAKTSQQASLAATEAKAAATNTSQLIGDLFKISRRTESIARGTERSVANSRNAAEAGQRAASATLGVARETAKAVITSQAGLDRIERVLSPFEEPSLEISVVPGLDGGGCGPAPAVPRASVSIASKAPRVIGSSLLGGEVDYFGDGRLEPYPRTPQLGCRYILTIPLQIDYKRGALSSYLDLPSKTLYVVLHRFFVERSKISSFLIRTRDGHFLLVPLHEAHSIPGVGEFSLQYTFPANRDPRSFAGRAAAPAALESSAPSPESSAPSPARAKRAAPPAVDRAADCNRQPVAPRVRAIIMTHLGSAPSAVTGGANFIDDLGADELDIRELMMAFEEGFCIPIPDRDARELKTMDDVVRYITSDLAH